MISKRILFSLLVSVIIVGCTIEKQVDSGNELALMQSQADIGSLYLNYSIPGSRTYCKRIVFQILVTPL